MSTTMKAKNRLLHFCLTGLAVVFASNVHARTSAPPPKVEPKSFAEYIGQNPHPDWIDPSKQAGPTATSDVMLDNVKYVSQPDTWPTPGPGIPQPCTPYFGNSFREIFKTTVIPTTDTVGIGLSLQPSLMEGNGWTSMALECSVTQGATTFYCSATSDLPVLLSRIKQSSTSGSGWRASNVSTAGYNGFVNGLTPGVEATVTIRTRMFSEFPALISSRGQVCYGTMAVNY